MSRMVTAKDLTEVLEKANADTDEDGKIILVGVEALFSFMGMGEELLIPEHVKYLVNGEEKSVTELLDEEQKGVGVIVIGED